AAQKLINLALICGVHCAIGVAVLEQAAAGQSLQDINCACQLRRMDAALNARQRVRQPSESARFARLAHPLPLRMIAILQASSRVPAASRALWCTARAGADPATRRRRLVSIFGVVG